jgi:hypothetical protein
MLRMCVCMYSRFVENHPIQILEDGPLISEVVLSQKAVVHLFDDVGNYLNISNLSNFKYFLTA